MTRDIRIKYEISECEDDNDLPDTSNPKFYFKSDWSPQHTPTSIKMA